MSTRRCPNCGGLVGADAEWCGQCLSRLDRPRPSRPTSTPPSQVASGPKPSVPTGAGGVRVKGDLIVWTCPVCETENRMDARTCERCGTSLGRLFEPPAPPPRITPQRAAILSLIFPGVGHVAAGKIADGLSRAVVFAFVAGMVVAILLGSTDLGGPLVPLMVLFGGAAAMLYVATAYDASRAVREEPPVLSTRVLLIGATALLLIATAVLILSGSSLPQR